MRFPAEIILQIAEHAQPSVLRNLMRTSHQVRELLQYHEKSVCAALFENSQVYYTKKVLTSSSAVREIVSSDTYSYYYEFGRREVMARVIVNEDLMSLEQERNSPQWVAPQLSPIRTHLYYGLMLCDGLADMKADYDDPDDGDALREAQSTFIRLFNLEQTIAVYVVIDRLSALFAKKLGFETRSRRINRTLGNLILSHGSWFVWCYFRGDREIEAKINELFLDEYIRLFRTFAGDFLYMLLLDRVVEKTGASPLPLHHKLLSIMSEITRQSLEDE